MVVPIILMSYLVAYAILGHLKNDFTKKYVIYFPLAAITMPPTRQLKCFLLKPKTKLLFAVTGKTAAELIVGRADSQKENMGLTSWKGAIVRKQDIITAKNYLTEDEIDTLNRLVVIFLETAELTVKERKDLTMSFWKENVDRLLNFQNKKILQGSGKISNAQMESHVEKIYDQFDQKRKDYEALKADQNDLEEIKAIESKLKKRNERIGNQS